MCPPGDSVSLYFLKLLQAKAWQLNSDFENFQVLLAGYYFDLQDIRISFWFFLVKAKTPD